VLVCSLCEEKGRTNKEAHSAALKGRPLSLSFPLLLLDCCCRGFLLDYYSLLLLTFEFGSVGEKIRGVSHRYRRDVVQKKDGL
jgi:hypothetical protein